MGRVAGIVIPLAVVAIAILAIRSGLRIGLAARRGDYDEASRLQMRSLKLRWMFLTACLLGMLALVIVVVAAR